MDVVTGRWAVSLRGWLTLSLLVMVSTLLFSAASTDLSLLESVAVGALRAAVVGAMLLLADRTYLRHRREHPAPLWLVLATWVAGGVLAVGVLQAVTPVPPGRWVAAITTFVLWSGLLAYIPGLQGHLTAQVHLLQISAQARARAQETMALNLADLRRQVRAIVARDVLPQIDRITQQLDILDQRPQRDGLLEIADYTGSVAREIVRDASREVADLMASASTSPPERVADATLTGKHPPLLLSPAWSTAFVVSTTLPLALAAPRPGTVTAVAVGIPAALLLILVGSLAQSRLQRRMRSDRPSSHRVTTALTVCWIVLSTCASYALVDRLGLLAGFDHSTAVASSLLAALILLALLGSVIQRDLTETARQARVLEATIAETDVLTQRTMDLVSAEKRRVATLVHGPVQGRLAAVALLLKLQAGQVEAGTDGSRTMARCRAILSQVRQDLEHLDDASASPVQNIDDRLATLQARWTGIATLTVGLGPGVTACLQEDTARAVWTYDAVEEATNNAVSHGFAQNVHATIDLDTDHAIRITVIDDGRGIGELVTAQPRFGLGLASIGRPPAVLALHEADSGGCRLDVVIPASAGTGSAPDSQAQRPRTGAHV